MENLSIVLFSVFLVVLCSVGFLVIFYSFLFHCVKNSFPESEKDLFKTFGKANSKFSAVIVGLGKLSVRAMVLVNVNLYDKFLMFTSLKQAVVVDCAEDIKFKSSTLLGNSIELFEGSRIVTINLSKAQYDELKSFVENNMEKRDV